MPKRTKKPEDSTPEDVAAPPPSAPVPTPPEPARAEKAAAPKVSAPAVAAAVKYRVKATTTVSLFGQIVRLPADSIISAESYGEDGMARIIDSNVPLEKLEG